MPNPKYANLKDVEAVLQKLTVIAKTDSMMEYMFISMDSGISTDTTKTKVLKYVSLIRDLNNGERKLNIPDGEHVKFYHEHDCSPLVKSGVIIDEKIGNMATMKLSILGRGYARTLQEYGNEQLEALL